MTVRLVALLAVVLASSPSHARPRAAPRFLQIRVPTASIRAAPHPAAVRIGCALQGEVFEAGPASNGWATVRLASRQRRYLPAGAVEAVDTAPTTPSAFAPDLMDDVRRALRRAASEAYALYPDDWLAGADLEAILADRYILETGRDHGISPALVGALVERVESGAAL